MRQDSNLEPSVLETNALPIELHTQRTAEARDGIKGPTHLCVRCCSLKMSKASESLRHSVQLRPVPTVTALYPFGAWLNLLCR